eukprot:TRINITY_DN479_c1_g2_i2.p3 TRINITY_DN479_c1_g2~~TRINITY_DN479_c1_g2_i2.p3  ORF type:complete len:197 (-),score=11.80 TRINITY_DN479_c1_g2_i2:511-1101(-)
MFLIGITGGIASGKSTVVELLRNSSLVIIDCDKIAKDVCKKGRWGWHRVVKQFGKKYLLSNGEIDRDALGKLVFENEEQRRRLARATHLPIAVELVKQIVWYMITCQTPIVIDMPLLFETRFNKYTQKNILVWCNQEQQIERLMIRDRISEEEALAKIRAQISLDKKKEWADVVFDNSSTVDNLKVQVNQWLQTLA